MRKLSKELTVHLVVERGPGQIETVHYSPIGVGATFKRKGKRKEKKRKRDHCLSSHMPVTEEPHDDTTSMTQSNARDDKNHGNFS